MLARMPADRQPPALRAALVNATAGAVFAFGVVACLELLSLALPGPRGTFRTWGPVGTVLAGGLVLVVGLPGALLVEAATRRAAHRTVVGVLGYLALAAIAATGLWLAWRRFVVPDATPPDLAREFAMLAAGAIAIWWGARLAETSAPSRLFAFGLSALALVVIVAALFQQ
jgi:hypothetical protein